MIKKWSKLNSNEKNYWLLIYRGQSKWSSQSDIPEAYLKPMQQLEEKREKQELEQDKKDNSWKYIDNYLGKRGRIR